MDHQTSAAVFLPVLLPEIGLFSLKAHTAAADKIGGGGKTTLALRKVSTVSLQKHEIT